MLLKIFLTFWLIVGVLAAAQEVAARLARSEEQRGLADVRRLVDEARACAVAYESGGIDAARQAIGAFEHRHGISADLLNAERKSILGRDVRPAELAVARQADRIATEGLPNAAVNFGEGLAALRVTTSRGERLSVVVGLPRSRMAMVARLFLVWTPARLAVILGVGGLLCFALARHITKPIVQLGAAANALADSRLQTRVGATVGTRRDELGVLARDFDRMAERIEALVAAQRRLLGDVSHELRSPLTRLSVALSLARKSGPEETAEYLTRIEREAGRLDALIEQLLTLARVESDVDGQLRDRVNLADLVQEVVSDADFEARAHGRRVTLLHADPCSLRGMGELLRSAIENVVRNAIRHTRADTAVEVTLRQAETGGKGMATLSVRDHGPGVPEGMLAEIFKPFWRAPGAEGVSPEGAGLGLAITERIVRMHDGRIAAVNAAGGGLTVTIDLPLMSS